MNPKGTTGSGLTLCGRAPPPGAASGLPEGHGARAKPITDPTITVILGQCHHGDGNLYLYHFPSGKIQKPFGTAQQEHLPPRGEGAARPAGV